jgi:hypothetical protein
MFADIYYSKALMKFRSHNLAQVFHRIIVEALTKCIMQIVVAKTKLKIKD